MKKKLDSKKNENKKEGITIKEQNPNRLEKADPRQFKVVDSFQIEHFDDIYLHEPFAIFEISHTMYLAYSPGDQETDLVIYNVNNKQIETTLKGFHENTITSIAYYKSPDGSHYLLIQGEPNEAYVIPFFDLQPVKYNIINYNIDNDMTMIFINDSYELIRAKYEDDSFIIGPINEEGEIKKIEISEKKDIPFIRPSIIDSYSSEKYTFLIFGSDSGVVLYELDSKKKERRKLFNDTYRYFHSFIKIKGELTLCLCTKKYDIDVWSIESNDINKLYSFKRINDYIPGCIFNWEDQFLLIGEKGYQKTDQRTGQKETFSNHILVIDLATQNTVQSLKSKDYSEFLFLTKMTEKNEDYLLSFEDPGLIKKWSSSSN